MDVKSGLERNIEMYIRVRTIFIVTQVRSVFCKYLTVVRVDICPYFYRRVCERVLNCRVFCLAHSSRAEWQNGMNQQTEISHQEL